jgi:hypothetical protein
MRVPGDIELSGTGVGVNTTEKWNLGGGPPELL